MESTNKLHSFPTDFRLVSLSNEPAANAPVFSIALGWFLLCLNVTQQTGCAPLFARFWAGFASEATRSNASVLCVWVCLALDPAIVRHGKSGVFTWRLCSGSMSNQALATSFLEMGEAKIRWTKGPRPSSSCRVRRPPWRSGKGRLVLRMGPLIVEVSLVVCFF